MFKSLGITCVFIYFYIGFVFTNDIYTNTVFVLMSYTAIYHIILHKLLRIHVDRLLLELNLCKFLKVERTRGFMNIF